MFHVKEFMLEIKLQQSLILKSEWIPFLICVQMCSLIYVSPYKVSLSYFVYTWFELTIYDKYRGKIDEFFYKVLFTKLTRIQWLKLGFFVLYYKFNLSLDQSKKRKERKKFDFRSFPVIPSNFTRPTYEPQRKSSIFSKLSH